MRSSIIRFAHEASHGGRTPMIHFLGKRSTPTTPHTLVPHPAAPKDVTETSFLSKLIEASRSGNKSSATQSSSSSSPSPPTSSASSSSGKPSDYEEFFQAPSRLWKPTRFSPEELEAVDLGGASA